LSRGYDELVLIYEVGLALVAEIGVFLEESFEFAFLRNELAILVTKNTNSASCMDDEDLFMYFIPILMMDYLDDHIFTLQLSFCMVRP